MISSLKADNIQTLVGCGSSPFVIYCRTIGLGSSGFASQARLCLQLGCKTAESCQKKLEQQLASGEIDDTSYRIRAEAVSDVQSAFERGIQTHTDPCMSNGGWVPYGENCHRRMPIYHDR